MTRRRRLTALLAGVCLTWAASVHADPVTHWNGVTVSAVTIGRPGPPGLLDIALVHLAIHDAVQAIEGRFKPYHYQEPGEGSIPAAVAGAAHRTLVLLYPSQQMSLDTAFNTYVTANGLAGDPGLAVGEAAGDALYAAHYRPFVPTDDFFGGTEPGEWRSAVPMQFLTLAYTEPFALRNASQFRPPPPPPLASARYRREYDEVKAVGSVSAHPNSMTQVARFWSVNFVAQWNEAIRAISDGQGLASGDAARLFALTNVAAADAAIAVWDSKIHYNYWRPVNAIPLGDEDGNKKTVGEPGWTPLFATPVYPDYVSGANGLTGAFTASLRLFFGTDAFSFWVRTTSPFVTDQERDYTRFSQAAEEVVEARIHLGIHFRAADEEGRRLGERIAHLVHRKFLRRVRGHHD